MAILSLLDITQDVLNDISGDEVNSIDDTVESVQVAAIIRSTFYDIMSTRNWPHTRRLVTMDASGDTCTPTHMTLTDDIKELIMVSYDKARVPYVAVDCTYCNTPDFGRVGKRQMSEVKYINPEDFLRMSNQRDNMSERTTTVCDPYNEVLLNIDNQNAPTYFTSFDDKTLVFDAFDSTIEDTLQNAKIQVYAYVMPPWVHIDEAIPELPTEAFAGFVEDCKSRAALKLRQQADQKSEESAQRNRRWMARQDWTVAGGIKFPNYGRGRGGYGGPSRRDPTFRRDN